MNFVLFALFLGVVGGVGMPLLEKSPKRLERYQERKAQFEAGQGKDPEKELIGPHKPFATNAIISALLFAVVGGVSAYIMFGLIAGF